jgi:hypothetical protein
MVRSARMAAEDATTEESSLDEVPAPASAPAVAEPKPQSETWRQAAEHALIVLGLVGLCVCVRLLWLEPIEISGDNTYKWNFVRQWFHDNDFSHAKWNHHMARFGINLPVFFVQALSAETARAYYVAPIASYTLQVLLVYALGRRLGGPAVGVISGIWLTIFTGMNRDASQLLPDGFGGTALVLTVYLMVRYQESVEAYRLRWLVATGLAFVWAYFVKESNLLLLPGVVFATWLCRRRWQDAALVGGMLAAAFVLETMSYRIFTDYTSRFAIATEEHGQIPITFSRIFDRFTRLEPPWQMLVWTWMVSLFGLLSTKDDRIRALLVIPVSFVFLLTFLFRSVDPLILWTRFMSRYFGVTLPLMIVTVVFFCAQGVRNAWPVYVPEQFRGWPARVARYGAPLSFGCCALVALVVYKWDTRPLSQHPLRQIPAISRVVNDAYRRNLPIVQEKEKSREERARGLEAIYAVFLKQDLILKSDLSKDGRLPNVQEVVRYQESKKKGWVYAWLVRDGRVYDRDQVKKLDEDGCALRVNIEDARFFELKPKALPERCKAPTTRVDR